MIKKLYKYRVTWRDLAGKKHRDTCKARTGYEAAQFIRFMHDDVDLVINVHLLKYQEED